MEGMMHFKNCPVCGFPIVPPNRECVLCPMRKEAGLPETPLWMRSPDKEEND